jgi:hypothetical protein
MFYQDQMDGQLRFGDIVKGYVLSNPDLKRPILDPMVHDYSIKINKPLYSVVVSPCCSIDKKSILLSPLIPVRNDFFDNPYFVEDLTSINRPMEPQPRMRSNADYRKAMYMHSMSYLSMNRTRFSRIM